MATSGRSNGPGLLGCWTVALQAAHHLVASHGSNQIKTPHTESSAKILKDMGVSKNIGTPKSSMLIGFSIINHPFWGTTIFGNTHMFCEDQTKVRAPAYLQVRQLDLQVFQQLQSDLTTIRTSDQVNPLRDYHK